MSLHCSQLFHYKTIKRQSDQEKKISSPLLGKRCLSWFSQLFFSLLNQLCHILTYQSHCDMSKTIVVFCALAYVMKHHTNEKSKAWNENETLLELECHNFPIIFLWRNFNQSPYNVIGGIWIFSITFPTENFFWQK